MKERTDPLRTSASAEAAASAKNVRPAVMRDEPEPQTGWPDGKHPQPRALVRYLVIGLAVLALSSLGALIYRAYSRVQVPNLVGQTLLEVRAWAAKNRLELDVYTLFDLQIASEVVSEQDIAPGTTVRKKSRLGLTVSKGPDPDERLPLPDFAKLTAAEIRAWIDETKAFNVNLVQQYSETVAAGQVIRMEFADAATQKTDFARRDYLAIYLSRGPQPQPREITLPDFYGYTREQVASWQQANDVRVVLAEAGAEEVPVGLVFEQDPAAGTMVAAQAEVRLLLSLGKGVEIPDYRGVYADDAAAIQPQVAVTVRQAYSNEAPYGHLISQSAPAGEMRYGEAMAVTLVYSLGRPYIGQLTGWMENELPAYFFAFNSKGCSLTYTVAYVDSHNEKGSVVRASRYNEYLWLASDVEIQVSKGNLPPPTEPAWPIATQPPLPEATVRPTPTPVLDS